MIHSLLRNQQLRNLIPRHAKVFYAEHRNWLSRVHYRSPIENIFHCCVHKTGSQWIRRMLFDPIVYSHCGLRIYVYHTRVADGETRPILERTFARPFPRGRVISPVYISFQNFQSIPKPENYRAVFVGRDPRDLAVSWLFSTRNAHPNMKNNANRMRLRSMNDRDGLRYAIQFLTESGEYSAMASWYENAGIDPQVCVVRYEDLVGADGLSSFGALFHHLDVRLSEQQLEKLLSRHSFSRQTGRHQGSENQNSKMRKGIAGDWRNHFDRALEREFAEWTGDLVQRLGYSD